MLLTNHLNKVLSRMSLKPGPSMPIKGIVSGDGDYIDFQAEHKQRTQRKELIDETKRRLAAEAQADANEERIKAWLIISTKMQVARKDTAISHALRDAACKALMKRGSKPLTIIARVVRAPVVKTPVVGDDLDMVPLPEHVSLAKKMGWFWNDHLKCYMKHSHHEDGTINRLHIGSSVKPFRMTPKEQRLYDDRVTGEVHCG